MSTEPRTHAPPFLRPPPSDRSAEQILHHYRVEKELAHRLLASSREERTSIYQTMYQTLFREVPDHPRLTRRESELRTRQAILGKLTWVSRYLKHEATVGEFGAGDCRFAIEMASTAQKVYAIDIADQSAGATDSAENIEVVVYDGYNLPIDDGALDLMVSDQLLEHLHPDDIGAHLRTVRRVLADDGVYLIRTPHAFTGPHDISQYFSSVAQGFHLKEWTHRELARELRRAGFSRLEYLRSVRGNVWRVPTWFVHSAEALLALVPHRHRKRLAHLLVKEVMVASTK